MNHRAGRIIKGRWLIEESFEGGMGELLLVRDRVWQDESLIAKSYKSELHDSSIKERFLKEVSLWLEIPFHPHVKDALYVMELNNQPFVFMRVEEGGDLSKYIGTDRLVDIDLVGRMAMQICDGMLHAYRHGLSVHRDLKPQNILLSADLKTAKVSDFGISKAQSIPIYGSPLTDGEDLLDPSLTRYRTALGTPNYMPPEQFVDARSVDRRADIYSFGLILFEILTGQPVFRGATIQALYNAHVNEVPPYERIRDRRLRDLLRGCLAKEPNDRPSDFDQLLQELQSAFEVRYVPATAEITLPVEAALLHNKAIGLNAIGELESALAVVSQALRINPNFVQARNTRSSILLNLERPEEALTDVNAALSFAPNYSTAHLNRGLALRRLGDLDDAKGAYRSAREHGHERASFELGKLHEAEGDLRAAAAEYATALEQCPDDPDIWFRRGRVLAESGQREQAEEAIRTVLDLEPEHTEALNLLGVLRAALLDYNQAITLHDKALAVNPTMAKAWFDKGFAYDRISQHQEALRCYNNAIDIDPEYASAWFNRGAVLVNAFDDRELAIEAFRNAQKFGHPKAAGVLDQLGVGL